MLDQKSKPRAAYGELEGARQSEPKGQRLILHIDQDFLVAIQKTEYKFFTGLSQELLRS
jgi:hypothetical protein